MGIPASMPQNGEISNNQLRGSLRRSRLFSVLGLITAVLGMLIAWYAIPTKPKPIEWIQEGTGPGIIRYYGDGMKFNTGGSVQSSQRADLILFENSNGSMKVLQPICQSQLGVHTHMRVEMRFHWAPYRFWHSGRGPDAGEECYQIDEVTALGADIQ